MSTLTIPNTITPGAEILAGPLADNFTTIASWANGGVGTPNLEELSVTPEKLANASVTEAKLADKAVTNAKLAIKIARGTGSFTPGTNGAYLLKNVSFPAGTFAGPPTVVIGWGGWPDTTGSWGEYMNVAVEPGRTTKDGFTAVTKEDGVGGKAKSFAWIAVGA